MVEAQPKTCSKQHHAFVDRGTAKAHLVGDFHDCWRPFVELIHPVRKSSAGERQVSLLFVSRTSAFKGN